MKLNDDTCALELEGDEAELLRLLARALDCVAKRNMYGIAAQRAHEWDAQWLRAIADGRYVHGIPVPEASDVDTPAAPE